MGEEGSPKTEMINPALLDGVSANFIVKGPNGQEKAYPMKSLSVTIGRSDQCDIAVKDSSMSGKHAEISKINGEIRVKDLGSANGIWLNGERVDDVELFDGDVLRCGQTSIRVDVVGGRKRPDAGMSPKVIIGIVVGVLVLAGVGIGVGMTLKKKAQHKRDVNALKAMAEGAGGSKVGNPCGAGQVFLGDIARVLNSSGKPSCSAPPKGDDAKRIVANFRDLSQKYNLLVGSLNQFATKDSEMSAQLASNIEQIADPELKGKAGELQELVDARAQVTQTYISDWKKLSTATATYANALDAAFLQGNKSACQAVEAGAQAKAPPDVQVSCTKNFNKAKGAVDDKLKELEDVTGGAGPTEYTWYIW